MGIGGRIRGTERWNEGQNNFELKPDLCPGL